MSEPSRLQKLVCRLIGHTRKRDRKWCPYSVMRYTTTGEFYALPAGGKYHLYCKRCGQGEAES